MPSRNSKGQFTSDLSIPLPGFIGIYKILFFAALIFPWYVIVSKHNFITWLFDYLVGREECPKRETTCPVCPKCETTYPVCPKYEGPCQPCPECPKPKECPKCPETSKITIS
jgi:hypothetical protein